MSLLLAVSGANFTGVGCVDLGGEASLLGQLSTTLALQSQLSSSSITDIVGAHCVFRSAPQP